MIAKILCIPLMISELKDLRTTTNLHTQQMMVTLFNMGSNGWEILKKSPKLTVLKH